MTQPITVWFKWSYEFVVLTAPGPRIQALAYSSFDDLATYVFANEYNANYRAAFNSGQIGASQIVYPAGGGPLASYFGTISHIEPNPNSPGSYFSIVESTTYGLLRATITEIAYTSSAIPPGPIPEITFSIGSAVSGSGPIPSSNSNFSVSVPAYRWIQGVVYDRVDVDGNGLDDRGQSQNANFDALINSLTNFTAPDLSLPALPGIPRPASISVDDMLAIVDLLQEAAEQAGSNARPLFEALGKLANRAGIVLDVAEAYAAVQLAGGSERAVFVESVNLAFKVIFAAGSVFSGPFIPVFVGGGAIYTLFVEDSFKRRLGEAWDRNNAASTETDSSKLDLAEPFSLAAAQDLFDLLSSQVIYFDEVHYRQAHPEVATAILAGTSSSALAHYLTIGVANGYRPNALTLPLAASDLAIQMVDNSPAAGSHIAARSLTLGTYAGDSASAEELALLGAVNASRGAASALGANANLFALANRLAIDLVANSDVDPLRRFTNGEALNNLAYAEGPTPAQLFPGVNLANTSIFVVASEGLTAEAALLRFNGQANTAAALSAASSRAIGIAEYGGVWVILVDSGTSSYSAPAPETAFALIQYGSSGEDRYYGGARAAELHGLDGGDFLVGGDQADRLYGGDGADSLSGGSGNDQIVGGADADLLNGGTGADLFQYFTISDSTASRSDAITDFQSGTDKIDLRALRIWSFSISAAPTGPYQLLTATGPDGVLQIRVLGWMVNSDVLTQVSGITQAGTAAADNYTGGSLDDQLYGAAGLDTLSGLAGDDLLDGGTGNDILIGGPGRDYIVGGPDNDYLIGGDGNDQLYGGIGSNTLQGGLGDDIYFIENAGDSVVEFSGEGVDEIRTALAIITMANNVDNLTYTGGTAPFLGVGNAIDNIIQGGTGRDELFGRDGNDILADVGATAGQGDFMAGGTGNDIYVISNAGSSTFESVGEGIDEVRTAISIYGLQANIENLTATDNATHAALVGNILANTIRGGTGTDDLFGREGNDRLIGGSGSANSLYGQEGDDIYIVSAIGDSVIEFAGQGSDRVEAATASFTLGAHVEDLTFTGSAMGRIGVGNDLSNLIRGAGGDDSLNGAGGDDVIIGGSGADILQGGTGADQFRFEGGETGMDRILDFVSGTDRIALSSAFFTPTGTVAFVSAPGATANSANSTFLHDSDTGIVWYDDDGNGSGAAIAIAQLNFGQTVVAGDFIFY